ncbi:DUF7344 domain-containing protein [Natronorubrum sp. FCH18a]|uniref:DUF7344 domain-containing protein n=1 Tax=Natronorubrum sp. FCH18a TaxID=3447018 RepID=UPI003F515487
MKDDNSDQEPVSEEPIESSVPTNDLSVTVVLEVIAHRQRREILRFLMDSSDTTTTIDTLAAHLRSRAVEQTGNHLGRSQIQIKTSLYHTHLPKLEEAGIIEYDRRSQELRYWNYPILEDILECLPAEGNG